MGRAGSGRGLGVRARHPAAAAPREGLVQEAAAAAAPAAAPGADAVAEEGRHGRHLGPGRIARLVRLADDAQVDQGQQAVRRAADR